MSTPSDSEFELDSWKVELEIALLEDADFFQIRKICANRPVPANCRADVWRACLRPDLCQSNSMATFAEVFDLDNQQQLHSDCEKVVRDVLTQIEKTGTSKASMSGTDGQFAEDTDEFADAIELELKAEPVESNTPTLAQLTSDFESVITHFSHTYNIPYKPELGWLEIIKTLYMVMKPEDRLDLYACFSSFYNRFVPVGSSNVFEKVATVFRLLLQYHEPKLCSFLDSLHLPPTAYASSWLVSLFAQVVPQEVRIALWDIYFLVADPLLVFFIALILLKNEKSEILNDGSEAADESSMPAENESEILSKKANREDILKRLCQMPVPMQVDDLTTLFNLTQLFVSSTPISFRTLCTNVLFSNTSEDSSTDSRSAAEVGNPHTTLPGAMCPTVSVPEILDAQQSAAATADSQLAGNSRPGELEPVSKESLPPIRYLIVDCRPAEQYNAGHLSTAFFLDTSLMLSNPMEFQSTVQNLLQFQRRALASGSTAAGEHIAILSSGRSEEMAAVNMVVAMFLRLNTPFVSVIEGGYANLHDTLCGNAETLNRWLVHHNPAECLSCGPLRSRLVDRSQADNQKVEKRALLKPTANTYEMSGEIKLGEGFLSRVSSVFLSRKPAATNDTTNNRKIGNGKPTSQLHKVINKEAFLNKTDSLPISEKPPISLSPIVKKDKHKVSYRNTSSVFTIDGDEVDDDDISETPTDRFNETTTYSKTTEPTTAKYQSSWFQRFAGSTLLNQLSTPDGETAGDIPTREEGLDTCEPGDLIDTTRWSSRPEVHGVFTCQFVESSGRLGDFGFLVLVERHLLVLRVYHPPSSRKLLNTLGSVLISAFHKQQQQQQQQRNPIQKSGETGVSKTSSMHAEVLRSVPLSLIIRITANRRVPECITFHYNSQSKDATDRLLMTVNHNESLSEPLKDRLYLSDAGEAVHMIKRAIFSTVVSVQSET